MATYSVIDVQKINSVGAQVTSVQTPAFASNPVTGDTILVAVSSWHNAPTTHNAPTDTAGNTYVQIGTTLNSGGADELSLWACVNATGGSTFRVTSSTSIIAYRSCIAWCFRPSSAIAYNGDVASAINVTTTNATTPTTSPAPSGSSFFICIASRPSANNALTEGSGWNTTGVNGFTSGMKTNATYGAYSTDIDCYTEYMVASAAQAGTWTDNFSSTALRHIIVASFGPAPSPINLDGSLTATGLVTGDLSNSIALAGSLSSTGLVAGALGTNVSIAGALAASGLATGALSTSIALAAALSATALVTGSIEPGLIGNITGSGLVAGNLSTSIRFAGALAASGLVTGSLTTSIRLAGAITGTALAAGNLTTAIALAGTLASAGSIRGSLDSSFPAALLLLF